MPLKPHKRARSGGLGAVDDDPSAIARRALREANAAIRAKDDLGLRQAAEKGWLAVSSAADVAAHHMKRKAPGGATGRRTVLEDLEKQSKLRRGKLLSTFEVARSVLHGECFHGGECPTPHGILGLLDAVTIMTEDTASAIRKLRRRR